TGRPLAGLRIGLPREFFPAALASDVDGAVRAALAEVEKLGATLVDVSLPRTELAIPVYYIIAPAEASSNLSRFDGVKFGHRAKQYVDLMDMYKKTRAEGFGDEVKRRIMIGTYVLSSGYYDAYYLKAQKIRRLISDEFKNAFNEVDVILSPTTPTTAFKIGEKASNPVSMYLSDIYTIAVNWLEVHAQLATRSKIFSGADTTYGALPNTQACAIDLGLPGVLPVLNGEVVRMAIRFGLSIDAEISKRSIFARKNYFYPDLP